MKAWKTRISYFPDDKNPSGVGIQLSKPGWFNDDGRGIHFETWITEKEIESKKLKFVLHVLHQDFFPGTEKKAWDLLWPFLEDKAVIDLVSEWKGFKMGRTHPVKGERKFKDSLVDVVAEEFTRFSPIGDRIDVHLKKILK
jgi:hypothetical protein